MNFIDDVIQRLEFHFRHYEFETEDFMNSNLKECIHLYSQYLFTEEHLKATPLLKEIFTDEVIPYIAEIDFTIRSTEKSELNWESTVRENYGYLTRCVKDMRFQYTPAISIAEFDMWLLEKRLNGEFDDIKILTLKDLVTFEDSIKRFSLVK